MTSFKMATVFKCCTKVAKFCQIWSHFIHDICVGPRFRGCSGTQYPQINGCYSEVQAVTLVMNKTSADVKVTNILLV